MNIDEMIEVLQAYKDGKELEWSCNVDNKDWVTFNGHNVFNFCSFVYRVKPEPREFWSNSTFPVDVYPTAPFKGAIKTKEVIE